MIRHQNQKHFLVKEVGGECLWMYSISSFYENTFSYTSTVPSSITLFLCLLYIISLVCSLYTLPTTLITLHNNKSQDLRSLHLDKRNFCTNYDLNIEWFYMFVPSFENDERWSFFFLLSKNILLTTCLLSILHFHTIDRYSKLGVWAWKGVRLSERVN